MLSGYKTYSAAAALALVGALEGFAGIDVPGVVLDENWVLILLNSLGLAGLRAAIGRAAIEGALKGLKQ